MVLNDRQEDALKEYMNLFIGQAGSLLSEMLNKKIKLTTPKILYVKPEQENQEIDEKPSILNSYVVSSSIEFGSAFSGTAQLIFPTPSSQMLVKLCLGEEDDIDTGDNLTDIEYDVIREIGNVLLNSVLGGLGNLLEVRLDYSLPEVQSYFFPEKEKEMLYNEDTYTFIILNSFSVEEVHIDGVIIMVLNMESILELIKKLDEVLVNVYG